MIQPLLRWKRRPSVTALFRPVRTALQFPIQAPARVAVLDDGFLLERYCRQFEPEDWVAMNQWAPEGIVAPLNIALSLADQTLRGLAALTSLQAAVILTDMDGERLAEEYLQLLWHAFGVPVFEQMRGPDGIVLARECEAHDGLHLDPDAEVTPQMRTALLKDQCECGSEAPRLRPFGDTRSGVSRAASSGA